MKTTSATNDTAKRPVEAALPQADHYTILGVDVSLTTDSPAIRDFFRAAFRRFSAKRAGAGRLQLTALMEPPDAGPYVSDSETVLELAGRPMPENRAFLVLLNALMDRVGDFVVVHGAAAAVNGKGVILAGGPWAGKSTLVIEMARRGATFFSDDVSPIHRATRRLQAFPRAVGIRRDGAQVIGFDPQRVAKNSVHELAYKWLVDPAALQLSLPEPGDTSCELEAVVFLDGGGENGNGGDRGGTRRMEIALAEADERVIQEVRAIPGVRELRQVTATSYPLFAFELEPSDVSRPMRALGDLCRDHRDVVLYLDDAHPTHRTRTATPALRQVPMSTLLMDLARDLQNRSETGALIASCGGLPGLVSEMARLFSGVSAFRLTCGDPTQTADLILQQVCGRGMRPREASS